MNDPIIIVDQLSHTYHSGLLSANALVDVSLEVECGSCLAVIGVTGSGKSTLVQHFNGLLFPTSGLVIVDGLPVQPGVDLRALRRRAGLLFQFPEAQLFAATVFADVAFGPEHLGLDRRDVRRRVAHALDLVGLPHQEYGHRSPFALSGGQMRRVALAGVIAMEPHILILDEPTTGFDAAARAEFQAYVRRIRQEEGATIILVSHDMAEVAALADAIAILHQGRLVLHGPPRAVFARADALAAWGLAPPPLAELLALLRARGLPVRADVLTLDEAFETVVGSW